MWQQQIIVSSGAWAAYHQMSSAGGEKRKWQHQRGGMAKK